MASPLTEKFINMFSLGNSTQSTQTMFSQPQLQTPPTTTSAPALGNTSSGFGGTSGGFGANSGGLFGGQKESNSQAGGLFSKPTHTGFGGGSSQGGLFGQPQRSSSAGGLMNSNSSNSGGLFGNNNNSNTSGGLFGSNNTNNNTNSANNTNSTNNNGGGLFGSNGNTSGTSGGLFGNNNTSNSGGLFGNNTSSGGLFNAQQQPQQQQQQQQQPQQPQQPQQQQQQQQQSGLFANSNNNTNNMNSNINLSNNLLLSDKDKSIYTPSINDQLIKIKDQWDPNSANCKLKTHFYNKLNANDLQILLNQPRPINESPDDWNKAMSERPNNQYYPVKITSFSDVSNRIETQLEHVKKSRYLLNLINENQSKLSSKHDLENSIRIKNCKNKHVKLSRRLLKLATTLAILKLRGYPLLPEEEEISKQFELLNSKLNDPNNSLSKLNDLFARLTILKEKSDSLNYQFNNSINLMNENLLSDYSMDHLISDELDNNRDKEDADLNKSNHEEFITKISKLLLKQQKGLNYINEILQKDLDTANNLTQS